MLSLQCFLIFFLSCGINKSLSTPTEYNVTEARGFASTLWDWITYPFTWWYYGSNENQVTEPPSMTTTTLGPYDNVEVTKRNITIWCNDQTCTTMKCDNNGCRNVTCNIYDTDVTGECREYNTLLKPDEPIQAETTKPTLPTQTETTKPIVTIQAETIKPIVVVSSTSSKVRLSEPVTKLLEISTTTHKSTEKVQERPLELEAVLSSTVGETSRDKDNKVNNTSNSQNKV